MQDLVEESSNTSHSLSQEGMKERPARKIFICKQDQEKCTRKTENCFLITEKYPWRGITLYINVCLITDADIVLCIHRKRSCELILCVFSVA
jgi:hypothetical protein